MEEKQSSYRQIMKATSLFGGVQVFNILIQIIRSKVIAVLLGPAGMGIMGLLNSTLNIIGSFTNFGLQISAVKDVSVANSTNNKQRVSTTIIVVKKLIWITGLLGTITTLILSSWLSQLTFGNKDYTFAFIWISITLLFKQITSGQLVILQGLRKLKQLASVNLLGGVLGLILTLPLYYIYGKKGIVPGIIGMALISLIVSWFFTHNIKLLPVQINRKQLFAEGKDMLKMGFMISLSGLLTYTSAYILRIFISRTGGIEDVGLYNAGFAIINTYVGLVFTAMATDYYPRLSAVANNTKLCNQTINQQAEIAILILAPIIIIFLIFINWVIIILYSKQFVAVNVMIYWAALGIFFKATSWAIAFIFLSKGSSKLFFINELVANIYVLIFNIIGYYYWGLTGLGISFMVSYIFYFIQIFIVSKIKFDFSFDRKFIKIFFNQFLLAVLAFFITNYLKTPYNYFIGFLIILSFGIYSFIELNKRLDLISIIISLKNKFNEKIK